MKNKKIIFILSLLLFLINFVTRFYFANQIKGVSGGDAYNNLFIASYIANGTNPFEGARRLPFYPLLLLPTQYFNIDPILYSRLVSLIFGSLLVVAIFIFSLHCKMDKFFAFMTGLITGFSPALFFISIRPLSNSTFAFLAVLSITLFYMIFNKKGIGKFYLLSIILGLMSMTRHEGFLISAIILFFLFIKSVKFKKISIFLVSIIPYVFIVLPFFINNIINFNTIFYSDYLEYPEGLYMPHSLSDLKSNFKKILAIPLEVIINNNRYLFFKKSLLYISIFGLLIFVRKNGKKSFPLILLLSSQIAVSLWYQPTIRYWLQILPFIIFIYVYALEYLSKKLKVFPIIHSAILVVVCLQFVFLAKYINKTVDDINHGTNDEYLLRQVLLKARESYDGKIGLPADYPQAVYFLKEKGVYYTSRPPKVDSLSVQQKWVEDNNIKYMIIPNKHDFLSIVKTNSFKLIENYGEGNDNIKLYKIND